MYGQERIKHIPDGRATTREVVENISLCRQTVWLQHCINAHSTVEKLPTLGYPTNLNCQIDNTRTRENNTMMAGYTLVFNGISAAGLEGMTGDLFRGETSVSNGWASVDMRS